MISYTGGKIAFGKKFLRLIPPADNFYDLFGGGGSITELAYSTWIDKGGFFGNNPKWKNIHYNEIQFPLYSLNRHIWNKEIYFDLDKPVDKKTYMADRKILSAYGAFVKYTYSFNSTGDSYLLNDRKDDSKNARMLKELKRKIDVIKNSPCIASKISMSCEDYRQVEIKPDSVVYCDIPYVGNRNRYKVKFSHSEFYHWAAQADFPVYFSDYGLKEPSEAFKLVWSKDIIVKGGSVINKTQRTECLFWNKKGVKR